MGFTRTLAKVGTLGLAGLALSKNKKRPEEPIQPRPSMITTASTDRPTSMIGLTRR